MTQMQHGLDRQANVLSELRQRASIVLSASGIVASLLGSEALNGDYSRPLAVVALAATAASFVACLSVLWRVGDEGRLGADAGDGVKRREWKVTCSGKELLAIASGEMTRDALLKVLAEARRANHRTLKARSKRFVIGCWLLLLQLVLWAMVLFERTW